MSINLFIERINDAEQAISLEDWRQVVLQDPNLRFRTEAYVAVNPATGAQIRLPAGEADSELLSGGAWQPFLRFNETRLQTRYMLEFEEPDNEFRQKVAAVAKALRAAVMTDVDDEPLNW